MRIIKESNERKNEILDVAEELFSQKGFDSTTISDIIERVGHVERFITILNQKRIEGSYCVE